MAQAPGWKEQAEAMNAKYPARPRHDDAIWADAIIFGTPTRFGSDHGGVESLYRQPGRALGQAAR